MSEDVNATISKRGVQNDDDLRGVVKDLLALSTSPLDSAGEQNATSILKSVGVYSDNHGIEASDLSSLIRLLTRKSSLPQTALKDLLSHLYPREPLSDADLLAIVTCLGKGYQKVDRALQDSLLQWLACLYPVFSETEKACLDKCYSVLWSFLTFRDDCGGLRALLAQMTRKHHATPLRLQKCLKAFGRSSLRNNSENGRGLLFWTMKIYSRNRYTYISGYKGQREPMWQLHDSKKLHRFRAFGAEKSDTAQTANKDPAYEDEHPPLKRIKLSPPLVNGLGHTAPTPAQSLRTQPIARILDTVEEAVAGPLLCRLEINIEDQFNEYLDIQVSRLKHQVYSEDNLGRILTVVVKLVRRSKQLSKSSLQFVAAVVSYKQQSGLEIPSLVEILGLLQLKSFSDQDEGLSVPLRLDLTDMTFITRILTGFEECCVDGNEDSLIQLLQVYTRILSSWSISWKTTREEKTPDSYKPFETLNEHASQLILRILSTFKTFKCHGAILSYFAVLADLASLAPKDHFMRVLRPQSLSVYILALSSPSLRSMEGQLSLLAEFKNSFEASLVVTKPDGQSHRPYDRDYVNRFNGFLMDLCNMLWRNRAFNSTDANARGCLIPEIYLSNLKQYTENLLPPQLLTGILGLSHHPTLAALSVSVYQELEDEYIAKNAEPLTNGSMTNGTKTNGTNGVHHQHDIVRHAGPVSQRSLSTLRSEGGADISWVDYRIHVLDWLADRGVLGVREMMESTMKTAMASRKRPSDAGQS